LFIESSKNLSLEGSKDYIPNIRPPRDASQLDLNFCFGESRLIGSEDVDSNMDNAVEGEHKTPDSNEVTMLQNPRKIFLRIFNIKWKIGRRWLYWSKPFGGAIIGVMKCEACEKFKLRGICSRTWGRSGCSTIQFSAVKNIINSMITSEVANGGLRNTIHQTMVL
jgi:hypothetical protein